MFWSLKAATTFREHKAAYLPRLLLIPLGRHCLVGLSAEVMQQLYMVQIEHSITTIE